MTLDMEASPRPRHTHIFERHAREHYVEPFWCDTRLFEVEDFGPDVLDPSCGFGRILRAAADAGYQPRGSDIFDSRKIAELRLHRIPFVVRDFLKPGKIKKVTSVVCNPPFDCMEAFIRRALEVATYKVASFCPLPRMPAAHWIQSLPLRRVYLLSPRPSVPTAEYLDAGLKPQGGRPEYCWLVFQHGWKRKPELTWLHRDGGSNA